MKIQDLISQLNRVAELIPDADVSVITSNPFESRDIRSIVYNKAVFGNSVHLTVENRFNSSDEVDYYD